MKVKAVVTIIVLAFIVRWFMKRPSAGTVQQETENPEDYTPPAVVAAAPAPLAATGAVGMDGHPYQPFL